MVVRINANPFPEMLKRAKQAVDDYFNYRATSQAHIREAHRRKREEAKRVRDGEASRESLMIAEEAVRSGRSLEEYAMMILDKPDETFEDELARRVIVDEIRSSTTPQALQSILDRYGIIIPSGRIHETRRL